MFKDYITDKFVELINPYININMFVSYSSAMETLKKKIFEKYRNPKYKWYNKARTEYKIIDIHVGDSYDDSITINDCDKLWTHFNGSKKQKIPITLEELVLDLNGICKYFAT
jgi:hypothetical protein